jgi:hypothetical protein
MLTAEIQKLDNLSKINLIDEIWQTIDDVNPPDWHKKVLQNRLNLIKNNEVKFVDIDDIY